MSYAGTREILDADSHVMELPDFLDEFVQPEIAERLYGGSRAQNLAMAQFCAADDRLLAVAYVPLNDPDRAVASAKEAIEAGCRAVMVPSTAAGERSPTHPDLDPFWDLLSEANIP